MGALFQLRCGNVCARLCGQRSCRGAGPAPPSPCPHPWLVSLPDAASKHAALGFFDCLRAEVEEYNVVVSTVSPTFIRSYRIDPGQGNWEASLWKCELFEGGWRYRAWEGPAWCHRA